MDQLPQNLVNYIILPYLHAMERAEHAEKMRPVFDMINRMNTELDLAPINGIFYNNMNPEFQLIFNIYEIGYCNGCRSDNPYHHNNGLHWKTKTRPIRPVIYTSCRVYSE